MPAAPCPKCGLASSPFLSTQDYNRKLSDEVFEYYRCDTCELIFLHPIPTDLGKYYPNDYYEIPASLAELAVTAEKLQRWKLETVQRFVRGGRLLEIGPAYGLFAYLAKQSGFEVNAIEMDDRCCQFLRDIVGINVIQSADPVTQLRELRPFDVIVLWQVLEHLPDPWSVLTAAAERIAPGGILVLDMPNPQAFQFRVLGRYWTHIDAPRHVELIPVALLENHLAEAGLRPVFLTASDKGSNGFNSFGWCYSFKNYFVGTRKQKIAYFMGRVLTKLLIPIERTGWRGSTYTAIFKKEGTQ